MVDPPVLEDAHLGSEASNPGACMSTCRFLPENYFVKVAWPARVWLSVIPSFMTKLGGVFSLRSIFFWKK